MRSSMNISLMEGLRKRPSYKELINEINKPFIPAGSFPDRKAIKLRNSNWLSQLDGDSHKAIETMHLNMLKEQEKEHLLKSYSTSQNVSLSHARAQVHAQSHQDQQDRRDDELFQDVMSPTPASPNLYSSWLTPQSSTQVAAHSPQLQPTQLFGPDIPEDTQSRHYHQVAVPAPMAKSTTLGRSRRIARPRTTFYDLAKDDLDEAVEQQHVMDIDDAEMNAFRSAHKLDAVLTDLRRTSEKYSSTIDKLLGTPENPTRMMKRSTTSSSSSYALVPVAKAKAKAEPIEDEEEPEVTSSPVKPRAKTKARTTIPVYKHHDEEEPEAEHSLNKKVKKTIQKVKLSTVEAKPKVTHGTQVSSLDADDWKTKGRGYLVDQLDLRKVPLTKTERIRMNKKTLIDKLVKYDSK